MDEVVTAETPYNFSLTLNSTSVNCSEFVHKAFASIGRKVGEEELFGSMNQGGFGGMLLQFLGGDGSLSNDSKVVTPLSVIESREMKLVASNLPVGKLLSDADVYLAWKSEGGLNGFSELLGIPMSMMDQLESVASPKPYREYPSSWRFEDCDGAMNGLPPL